MVYAIAGSEVDDGDLVLRCRRGDEGAWSTLLDRYERLVYSIPLNYGLGREDAADVAQTTFTELLRQLDVVRGDEGLGAWLATVARRTTWQRIARRKREQQSVDDTLAQQDDPWHEWIDTWADRNWVVEAVLALQSPCRDLLVALYLDPDEPSYEVIAERLGRPQGSIGPTRGRCLDKLRTRLATLDEHP